MTRWTTRAIVIGAEPLGESDRGVRLLTPGQGRLFAVAKGAARSRKRFSGVFDFPELVEFGLTTARGDRVLIEHAQVLEPFSAFRRGPLRLARAGLLIEVAKLTMPERHHAPAGYSLVENGLFLLHGDPDSDRFAVVYAYRLLTEAGYRPELGSCVRCGREVKDKAPDFSPGEGGIVCRKCGNRAEPTAASRAGMIRLSPDTLNTLRAVIDAEENRLSRYRFTRRALDQARELLHHFCAHLFSGPLNSLVFRDQLVTAGRESSGGN